MTPDSQISVLAISKYHLWGGGCLQATVTKQFDQGKLPDFIQNFCNRENEPWNRTRLSSEYKICKWKFMLMEQHGSQFMES